MNEMAEEDLQQTRDVAESALIDYDSATVTVEELSEDESWAVFDTEARTVLGLSGAEFAYRWQHGEYADNADPRLARVAMLYPRAWQCPALATREELIELGARAIQPAYGAATVRKAALVVDAILARYAVTSKQRTS
jgi:hypothetical protein